MGVSQNKASIFSHKLDRVAFISYLLGAVVPLLALGFVVDRYVLPAIQDRISTFGLIGLFVSVAVLSLASFFTLRRTTLTSLDRMDSDNRRLSTLLDVSNTLADVEHADDAASKAARSALTLSGARASLVMVRAEPGAPPTLLASAGDEAEKLEEKLRDELVELSNLVLSQGRPGLEGARGGGFSLAAVPLPGEVAPAGVLVTIAGPGDPRADGATLDALSTLGSLVAVGLHNANLRDAQRNFFTHVTDMLVTALDSNLGYHKGHGNRVAHYANRIGRQLQLDEHRLQRLHFAALLHDIGMIKLERHQQQTAKGSAKHTILGARMLTRIKLWKDLAPIIQHHHEWWDGSGHPDGLSGQSIPLESRIIAVCDAFDAMTSRASYKDPLTFEAAVREIETCSGTQFAPDVVAVFLELVRDGHMEIVPVD